MAKTKAKTKTAIAPGSLAGRAEEIERLLATASSADVESFETEGLSPEEARAAEKELARQLASAESDDQEREERVGLRWAKSPLRVVQKAALLAGVPYQTYVKMAAYRQALSDLKDAAIAKP